MAALGNIIWFVFLGGFLMGVGWLLAGCILCLTIVGIPFGMACFRIASFAFFPFGKELVDVRALGESRIAGTTLANIVWFVLAGLWLAIGHVVSAIACLASCLLILPLLLGAPAWALAHLNLARVALAPLGKRIVPKGAAYRSQIAVAGSGRLENRLRRLPDPVDEIDLLP
ncbi:MAG: YccF family protein [Deltaproteobacteria bacterium]|nr:MAG: YccF family protein [Deltaproteobacteria bacterium]TMB34574.1 MAG: YccF family protein [Deltaproteobacteria bacterium]